jgi:hypothetical protein
VIDVLRQIHVRLAVGVERGVDQERLELAAT